MAKDKENKRSDELKAAEKAAKKAAKVAGAKAEAAAEAAREAAAEAKEAAQAAAQAAVKSGSSGAEEQTVTGEEIFEELGRIGSKVINVVGAAWSSDYRRNFETELRDGLSSFSSNVEVKVDGVRSDPNTQEKVDKAKEKAKDVAETVAEKLRENETAQDVASGMVSGLRFLSKQLDNLATELQKSEESKKASDDSQDIPINKG